MNSACMESDWSLIIISITIVSVWPLIFSSLAWPTSYHSLSCSCSLFIRQLHLRWKHRIFERLRWTCWLSFEYPSHHSLALLRWVLANIPLQHFSINLKGLPEENSSRLDCFLLFISILDRVISTAALAFVLLEKWFLLVDLLYWRSIRFGLL